ncbi:MAG: neutral/alkaline non-lysosomal ceramidase N-terminal domain-containing protein [Candidatus Hydrogenedentes bacterium]|nr:neutral/alkaline non-lysosomal ceramidase N-terminal domain-containing protein [Candidatus Hydrogenedentota bacterium]
MKRVLLPLIAITFLVSPAFGQTFKAGFAKRDITPQKMTPMWGYGARHAAMAEGAMDTMYAKALVIDVGTDKLALVGLDLGRGPTEPMMAKIREKVKTEAGVNWVLISGSHTHHGPVIELKDEEGKGKGKYDDAVAYAQSLPDLLSEAIIEAANNAVDAKIGWGSMETDLNRNRHTKKQPKPRDPELAVVRVDDLAGKPIAILVNFAAHPTILDTMDLRYSAEWPGKMYTAVEEATGANCFFMQGAAGDMSPNTNDERRGIEGFGKAVAEKVLEINAGIETEVPESPSIVARIDDFSYDMRIDLSKPVIIGVYKQSFFPELLALADEFQGNKIRPQMTTVLLNGRLALVSGSGEFFCQHANHLKAESPAEETYFLGYCNGHHMYFPTRDAVEEGGYGADAAVSWVAVGAGEEMIEKALQNLREMTGVSKDALAAAAANE